MYLCLIKNKTKCIYVINYYRPIAIVPIVNKLFESCMSETNCNLLHTCSNQLGFVHGGGCSRAIVAVKAVIKYFLQNNSAIFLSSLDARKLSIKINHFGLLNTLTCRGVPKLISCYFIFGLQMFSSV